MAPTTSEPTPSSPLSSRRASSASLEKPPGPLSIPIVSSDRETIKVNNASGTELKNACDDALKRVGLPLQLHTIRAF